MKTDQTLRDHIRKSYQHDYAVGLICDDANLAVAAIGWIRRHAIDFSDMSEALRAAVDAPPCYYGVHGHRDRDDLYGRLDDLESCLRGALRPR
jgi:hypothetical protein